MRARAAGLALGYAADRVLGDPARFHPVAGFGTVARALERRAYRDDRVAGARFAGTLVGTVAAAGVVAELLARRPLSRTLVTAISTWAALGGRSLGREAAQVRAWLDAGDLPAARVQLTHLVGRDPTGLDQGDIARAVVESVAENTSDAVVAPLLAGALGGVAGVAAYRAANTLDAMVGHRSTRYRDFGWAAARLDDALNLVPSRLSAVLAVCLAPVVGGSGTMALRAWTRDAHRHPSPNAGPVEAAFAGALGVQLGGTNVYGARVEHRPRLGVGPPADRRDIDRSVRLSDAVGLGALLAGVGVALRRGR